MSLHKYDYPTSNGDSPNNDMIKRVLIVVGGLMILSMIFFAIYLLLFSKPSLRSDYSKAAAAQSEVLRIAEIGLDNDQSSRQNLNNAANAKIISADTVNVLSDIVSNNFQNPLTSTSLSSATSDAATQRLADADASNSFNEAFAEILPLSIQNANEKIKAVFEKVETKSDKAQLSTLYENNSLLLESLEQ